MSATRFRSVSPILTVSNVDAAIAFYESVMGFQTGWKWGTPTTVASVCRDGVELMLESAQGAAGRVPSRIYIVLSGLDSYYAQLVAAGANITVALAVRDYGMKDCRIVDPDGNEISFGESGDG